MANEVYRAMTDQTASAAIRSCIHRAVGKAGSTLQSVKDALKDEFGITGVALDFSPRADKDGSLHNYRNAQMRMFQFMAHGPSGKTIG